MNNSQKTAIIYARTGTKVCPERKSSIAGQIESCTEFAENLGYKIQQVYCDEGRSGATTKGRTSLSDALERIQKGDISALIVQRMSALSRRTLDLLDLVSAMERQGVKFLSVQEQVEGNSSINAFSRTIMLALAEYESRTMSNRIKEGIRRKKARQTTQKSK